MYPIPRSYIGDDSVTSLPSYDSVPCTMGSISNPQLNK